MIENNERQSCVVYSRVCGYLTPTSQWNDSKSAEFKDRVTFNVTKTGQTSLKQMIAEKEGVSEQEGSVIPVSGKPDMTGFTCLCSNVGLS